MIDELLEEYARAEQELHFACGHPYREFRVDAAKAKRDAARAVVLGEFAALRAALETAQMYQGIFQKQRDVCCDHCDELSASTTKKP